MKGKYSNHDIERNIIVPGTSDDLAELFGIISGDGYIIDRGRVHRIDITLNLTEDSQYVGYVSEMIKRLFNLKPVVKARNGEHTFNVIVCSKGISNFLISMGLPNGEKKNNMRIPKWIIKNKGFIRSFLRGLMDTDGSLFFAKRGTYKTNSYPVIEFKLADKNFVNDITESLKLLGFSSVLKSKDNWYKIQLNGRIKVERWAEEIGFENLNSITRYIIWNRFGYCPPKTNLKERIENLNTLEWQNGHALDFLKRKGEPAEQDNRVRLSTPALMVIQ
jgi:intein/homing endonuclease